MKTILFLMLLPLLAPAQYSSSVSANPYADFGAYSRLQTPVTSVVANPAALPSISGPAAVLSGERKFMLPELGHYMALAVFPKEHQRKNNYRWCSPITSRYSFKNKQNKLVRGAE